MSNRLEGAFTDLRQHKRVAENKRIGWSIDQQADIHGNGRIINLSESGLMLETNSTFTPQDGQVFNFDSGAKQFDYLPSKGKIIWSKRKNNLPNQFLCGVEFINSTEFVRTKLADYLNTRVQGILKKQWMEKALSVSLTGIIVALTGWSIWYSVQIYAGLNDSNQQFIQVSDKQATLTTTFQALYKETQVKLAVAEVELETTRGILESMTRDLESTKAILTETESMLSLERNNVSQNAALRAQLQAKIADLETQNKILSQEMAGLRDEIRFYEGNVQNIEEGKLFLMTYKDRVKLVKERVKVFKSEAEQIRRRALRERDRILMELGNNGYLVKNGAAVKVDTQKYNAVSNAKTLETLSPDRSFDVNVKIVE